jgi:hypothetical protein
MDLYDTILVMWLCFLGLHDTMLNLYGHLLNYVMDGCNIVKMLSKLVQNCLTFQIKSKCCQIIFKMLSKLL